MQFMHVIGVQQWPCQMLNPKKRQQSLSSTMQLQSFDNLQSGNVEVIRLIVLTLEH